MMCSNMQYSGSLTREQSMFQEIRIAAYLKLEGLDDLVNSIT